MKIYDFVFELPEDLSEFLNKSWTKSPFVRPTIQEIYEKFKNIKNNSEIQNEIEINYQKRHKMLQPVQTFQSNKSLIPNGPALNKVVTKYS